MLQQDGYWVERKTVQMSASTQSTGMSREKETQVHAGQAVLGPSVADTRVCRAEVQPSSHIKPTPQLYVFTNHSPAHTQRREEEGSSATKTSAG